MPLYSTNFYKSIQPVARSSAHAILPIILDLLNVRSAVDVGCGTADWLAELRQRGVERVVGIDGPYVLPEMLQIPRGCFISADLTEPIVLDDTFDLVLSLEVAEHLPERSSGTFVDSLVALGPAILFSAAIPCQRGHRHLNEQWPEYWADLFEDHGYVTVDCVRPEVWRRPEVGWYYAQNSLLFVREAMLADNPRLSKAWRNTRREQLALVHPGLWKLAADPDAAPLDRLLSLLPRSALRAITKRVQRIQEKTT